MKRLLFPLLLTLSLTASVWAAPVAILTRVAGDVSVFRGAKQLTAKSGLQLENGDKVTVKNGSVTLFSLSGPPRTLKNGSLVVGAGNPQTSSPRVWSTVYTGLHNGLNKGDRRIALTMRPGEMTPLSPIGGLIESSHPTFSWRPENNISRYEVVVKSGETELLRLQTEATSLPYPASSPDLTGSLTWQVTPLHFVDGQWRSDAGGSAPVRFQVATAAQLQAVRADLAALDAGLKTAAPTERLLARAALWEGRGFPEAALRELESIRTDPAAHELQLAIWQETGQSWRLTPVLPEAKEPIGSAVPEYLAYRPEDPFVLRDLKPFTSPDGLYALQLPQCFSSFTRSEAPGPDVTDFGAMRDAGARLMLVHSKARLTGKAASPWDRVCDIILNDWQTLASYTLTGKGTTTFRGQKAQQVTWKGKSVTGPTWGGALLWTEGGQDFMGIWGGEDEGATAAMRSLLDGLKIIHAKPVRVSDAAWAALVDRMYRLDDINNREVDSLNAHMNVEAYQEPLQGAPPTAGDLEAADKKRLAEKEGTFERADADLATSRLASRLGWLALDENDSATAGQFFQRAAALKAESYTAERSALEAEIKKADANLLTWEAVNVPPGLGDKYYTAVHGMRLVQGARFILSLALSQQNTDPATYEKSARRAFELARSAQEWQRLVPHDPKEITTTTTTLGAALQNLGQSALSRADLNGARAYDHLALRWLGTLAPTNTQRKIIITLQYLAEVERQLGDNSIARQCYLDAFAEIDRLQPIHDKEMAAIRDVEDRREAQGWWDDDRSTLFISLAEMETDAGDYAAAEAHYHQGIQAMENSPTTGFVGNMRARDLAEAYTGLATLHTDEGDLTAAAADLTQCVQLSRSIGDDGGLADALTRSANLDITQGKYPVASGKLQDARAIFDRLNAPRRALECDMLAVKIARKTGDTAGGIELCQKTLVLGRSLGFNFIVGIAARNLVMIRLAALGPGVPPSSQDKTELEALIQQIEAVNTHLNSAMLALAALQARAALAYQEGDLEASYSLLSQAIARNERVRATAASSEAFSELEDNYSLYNDAVNILLKLNRPEEAFDMLSRARSKKLRDELSLRQLKSNDPALQALLTKAAALDDKLEKTRAQLVTETAKPAPERDPTKLKNLGDLIASTQQQFFDVSEQIKDKNLGFAKALTLSPTELKKAQRAIPKGSLLLQYAAMEDRLYIFAVTRDSLKIYAPQVSRNELNERIHAYRAAIDADVLHLQKGEPVANIDFPTTPLRGITEQLSNWLLGPVRQEIKDAQTVAIIPSGELFYLPFHALGQADDVGKWHFLIEDKPVAYLTSGDVLSIAQERDIADEGKGVLALGDPTGADLPDAKEEVETIAKLFPDSQALTGAGATKAVLLLPESRDKRVLHLAAHGVLDSANPKQSFIQLSPSGKDDGKLRVGEIVGLDLNKVDLVTLSACRTALGEGSPDGTEISSLAQSFSSAGTPSVIASLWNVEDSSTAALMKVFYGELVNETPKGVALQRAQLALVKDPKTRQPVYWAPFELMGDWR